MDAGSFSSLAQTYQTNRSSTLVHPHSSRELNFLKDQLELKTMENTKLKLKVECLELQIEKFELKNTKLRRENEDLKKLSEESEEQSLSSGQSGRFYTPNNVAKHQHYGQKLTDRNRSNSVRKSDNEDVFTVLRRLNKANRERGSMTPVAYFNLVNSDHK